jgi:hypothetical protein
MMNAAGQYEKWDWVDWSGAGAMVSTIDDMLRWLAHMNAPVIGGASTWELMKGAQRLANGTVADYGFGLIRSRYRGIETLHNPGGWLGGSCQMLKVPAAMLDVVVIANRFDADVMGLVQRVLDACLPHLHPVEVQTGGNVVQGVFRSPTTGRVVHLSGKDGRQIVSIGGSGQLAVPDESGVLTLVGGFDIARNTITLIGEPTAPSSIRLHEFGNADELILVRPAGRTDPRAFVGRYRSDSTDTNATVTATDAGLSLRTTGRFGGVTYDLECLAENIWRASSPRAVIPPGGVLSFADDCGSFHYSTSQTRPLAFRRCS